MIYGRITKTFSSWWLTTALLIVFIAAYICFSAHDRSFEKWLHFLFHSRSGMALYILLILNLVSASIRIVCKRLKKADIGAEYIKGMDTFAEIPLSDNSFETISKTARETGFSKTFHNLTFSLHGNVGQEGCVEKSVILNEIKGGLSFLPGTVVRTGLIILFSALLVSSYSREMEEKTFHEGQEAVLLDSKVVLNSIKSDMPDAFLQIGEKDNFILKNISARVTLSSGTTAIHGGLPERINGIYYRLINMGFYQPVSVKGANLEISQNANLDILPPGKSDAVSLQSGNLELSFMLKPEKEIKKGTVTGKVFNLKNPEYVMTIKRGKEKNKPEHITIKPENSTFVNGLNIPLGRHSYFVKIMAVHDPALFWIYAGIILALAGIVLMPVRFFWYEKQICAVLIDNKILIGYREEFFKKWGILKFHKWIKEFK